MKHRILVVGAIAIGTLAASCASDPAADAPNPPVTDPPSTDPSPSTTATQPATTVPASSTSTTQPTNTTTTTTTATTAGPATNAPDPAATTTTTTTVTDGDPCRSEPWPPPFLPNGQDVGEPSTEQLESDTLVTWGAGTGSAVSQILDSQSDDSFATAESFDAVISIGDFEAAVVPLGPPTAPVSLDIRESDGPCTRQYSVEAQVGEAGADRYAHEWLSTLAGLEITTARLAECPAVTFTTLLDGWGPEVLNVQGGGSGLPGNHIGGPNSYVNIYGDNSAFGPRNGDLVGVDGIEAFRDTIEDGLGVALIIDQPGCEFFDLSFFGASPEQVTDVLNGIQVG